MPVTDGSQRCEHCQRYAAEVEQGGERVIQARDGSGITLCAGCIRDYWYGDYESDELTLRYLMALMEAAFEDELLKDQHDLACDLADGLVHLAGHIEREARYASAYKHGVEVERSRAKGEREGVCNE